MLYLSDNDAARLADFADMRRWVREGFSRLADGQLDYVPRQRLDVAPLVFNMMAAADRTTGRIAAKLYLAGKRKGTFYLLLWDGSSGALLAMMAADELGRRRTGAASVVATDSMAATASPTVITLFGTGFQALGQLAAFTAAYPQALIRVVARRQQAALDMLSRAASWGLRVRYELYDFPHQWEAAVQGSSVIITATSSIDPFLHRAPLDPRAHINAIGSNHPAHAELAQDVLDAATVIALDDWLGGARESGDLLRAYGAPNGRWAKVTSLSSLIAQPRASSSGITVFLSQGFAVEDLVTASHIYDRAKELGIGQTVEAIPGLPGGSPV